MAHAWSPPEPESPALTTLPMNPHAVISAPSPAARTRTAPRSTSCSCHCAPGSRSRARVLPRGRGRRMMIDDEPIKLPMTSLSRGRLSPLLLGLRTRRQPSSAMRELRPRRAARHPDARIDGIPSLSRCRGEDALCHPSGGGAPSATDPETKLASALELGRRLRQAGGCQRTHAAPAQHGGGTPTSTT